LRAALQLGCHRSINNNQSAQTGNTHQYCKHAYIDKRWTPFILYSLVYSFGYRPPLGHTKKVKTARGFTV
jgi:hypothetical protein